MPRRRGLGIMGRGLGRMGGLPRGAMCNKDFDCSVCWGD